MECFYTIIRQLSCKNEFLHHMRHTVFFVAISDIVGCILHLGRGICHCHAKSGKLYHALIVISVATGNHLFSGNAKCSYQLCK